MAETEDKPLTEAEVVRVQPGPGLRGVWCGGAFGAASL